MLLGACASDALKRFVDRLKNNSTNSLPSEIAGISVFVVEFEEKEKLGQKFDELGRVLEACSGRGIVASFGDLESLIGDDNDDDSSSTGSYMVSKLTEFLERFKEKLWLIGAAASYDVYSKFLKRFHSVEKDWDLQLLPITSSSSSISKSSLLGSFSLNVHNTHLVIDTRSQEVANANAGRTRLSNCRDESKGSAEFILLFINEEEKAA
ncbi:Protein SMAX1-LIKE 8, partial [Linum perenne]